MGLIKTSFDKSYKQAEVPFESADFAPRRDSACRAWLGLALISRFPTSRHALKSSPMLKQPSVGSANSKVDFDLLEDAIH